MKRYRTTLLVLLVGFGLAGCGSSSSHQSRGDVFTGMGTTAGSTAPAGATASTPASATNSAASSVTTPDLKQVAIATQTQPNTQVSESYQVGPLGYDEDADAASEAIQNCQDEASSTPETNAYAQGQVTINYSQGSLPIQLMFSLDSVLRSADIVAGNVSPSLGMEGDMALQQSDGSWACGGPNDPNEPELTLQPGATITEPFWLVLPHVRTNAHPTLSRKQLNSIVFYPVANIGDNVTFKFEGTGPKVYTCPFGSVTLPFASGHHVVTTGGSCRSGS